MSFRDLPGDDADQVRQWMQDVVTAIDSLERQQPVFGPAIRIGNIELRSVTTDSTVHIYAVNTITGASVMLA
jgi:predicted ribonuclease YlaK